MNSQILLSNVVHKRFIPFTHNLKYKVPSLYLNIDDLDKLKEGINNCKKIFDLK